MTEEERLLGTEELIVKIGKDNVIVEHEILRSWVINRTVTEIRSSHEGRIAKHNLVIEFETYQ